MSAERSWRTSTRSARGTRGVGRRIGEVLEAGTVLALNGDLGAGKTTFVQGLAAGLGVVDLDEVLSPTYTLVNEYPAANLTLIHIDFYRLDDPTAARALGLEEYVGRCDAVVAIEWPKQIAELIPTNAVWIELARRGTNTCEIEVRGIARPRGIRPRG
ncbi:MAG: tRNA (adenosine(37)-N6)-threonylcarbamoyltransferase complex ATPase subunit type 1 TsaE [Deltaproteobacteria bacterium RIFOXYA12_FULL_58_15]|nr:MAG: tRNA (adenosine(37)-N6)-threonylcarbamoyltransferase complex ATPase subunit type 1 TsaE [Deltaproteobacteria bacterium RIFOXYA12_FULL_58_15]OGR13783.1 MAG: tRNA (adenosine(37)-N6)-threonylcarbamoyltransferase complex ATPase subunit type 1 TsaE [Deltaproteobacteria bacterium RIFOXYB12_FULL_58_9]